LDFEIAVTECLNLFGTQQRDPMRHPLSGVAVLRDNPGRLRNSHLPFVLQGNTLHGDFDHVSHVRHIRAPSLELDQDQLAGDLIGAVEARDESPHD